MPISSITIQQTRDGRPENICWCGYPKVVCGHGPEIKSASQKHGPRKGDIMLSTGVTAYKIREDVIM